MGRRPNHGLDHHLAAVVLGLTRRVAGIFSRETIERFVDDTLKRWCDARVTEHLPILVERFVKGPVGGPGTG